MLIVSKFPKSIAGCTNCPRGPNAIGQLGTKSDAFLSTNKICCL